MSHKKNIFICRHGHATFTAQTDFNRELTAEGIQAVSNTALFIQKQCEIANISPELCISSSALRTKQTAKIIAQSYAVMQCDFYQELYSTNASQWLEKITKAKQNTIILVGHNPTLSQLVQVLSGHEFYMQPANCAFITLEIKPDGFIYPALLNHVFQNE